MAKIGKGKIAVASGVPVLAGSIAIGDVINKEQIQKFASEKFSTILKTRRTTFQGCKIWLIESFENNVPKGRWLHESSEYLSDPDNIQKLTSLEAILSWESFKGTCTSDSVGVGVFEVQWSDSEKSWIDFRGAIGGWENIDIN